MKGVEEQMALIRRGVDAIVPEEELIEKLKQSHSTGKPLRVKYGIDPTGIDVHLGHTVPLRKLRLFQDLGHQAVIIIGNYTALVGDPSGRDQTRARLSVEQVEANARDYLAQVSKVIDITRAEVRYNGEWFSKYTFLDTMTLASKITVQRMLERDDFTKRFKAEPSIPIYLHECLYPLMQGQDSVEIRADIELGGSEQLFNLMMGRKLQEDAGQKPQVCITLPILRGLDGKRRMGKSLQNYIGVGEPPYEMFAKVMSIPDDLMPEWFELLTDEPSDVVRRLLDAQKVNPRDAKFHLGKCIVKFYYSESAAEEAEAEWKKRFSGGGSDPSEIPEAVFPASELANGSVWICKLLTTLGLAESNNHARRLVQQGGVRIGPDRENKVTDPSANIEVTDGLIVRVGSRKVVQVRLR